MSIPRRLSAVVLVATQLCAIAGPAKAEPQAAGGVIVESVAPGSTGEAAGLRSGDTILAWSCAASPPAFPQPSRGSIRSPYDLLPLEIEEAPRRAVTLRGKRGDQEMLWILTAGEWGLEARPELPADLAAPYQEGKARIEAGDLAAAERSWRSAAVEAQTGDGRLAAWFLDRLARKLAEAGRWPEADAAYGEALLALERRSEHAGAAQLLRKWADSFDKRGALDAAVERLQKALEFDRRSGSKSLAEARTLHALGLTAAKKGDHPTAMQLLGQGLAIREELAPGTTEVTGSLRNLGILARRHGDLAAAEEYLTRGEELQRRLAPESADHASFLLNLGNVAQARSDLERAEAFQRQALEIYAKAAPGGEGVGFCLNNLANVAFLRGDLTAADDLYRQSLALKERRAALGLDATGNLINLGNVALRRGDFEAAKDHYLRALALSQKLSPDGQEVAWSQMSLGILAAQQSDFAVARDYLRHSLATQEKLSPGSLKVAVSLGNLGLLEIDGGGDLAAAEGFLRQALAIFEKEAPESLEASDVLRNLGLAAGKLGHSTEALALYRRALDLKRKLAPGSISEAEGFHLVGIAERRTGRHEEGNRDLCHAIDVLDSQRSTLGGLPEARTSFEASVGDYYYYCLDGLIGLGRLAEAFHALERGRARFFLALLADRDLRLKDVPPKLAAERRQADAEYDRVQSRFATLRDDVEIQRLAGELRDLRTRQEEITARLRRESPRSAALQNPEPLELASARAALDPGTVLLEYAVGAEKTWLFVVQSTGAGTGLTVFPIALGAKALREEVEGFRRLLQRPTADRAALQAKARRLYGLLIHPAEARIDKAQRLLVSPDGALHTLPFAALMRGNRYLVERKPIHTVLSATVYAELKRARPARPASGEERLAAFGDPVYPPLGADTPSDPELREVVRRGFALKPLPSSREEVEGIAALFPQARTYLGREATEARAKSLGPETRLVHFACHGLLDERFPLNSALALTLPDAQNEGRDNGLLQAWEIFESVHLDAALVTLSACDTALGKEMGGEGLVGLTRAFQYAGARSVLASLWSISDASTAELMKRFYGYLRGGKPKDEALRAAQIDQIRQKSSASHPFHWAAFELFGDWR